MIEYCGAGGRAGGNDDHCGDILLLTLVNVSHMVITFLSGSGSSLRLSSGSACPPGLSTFDNQGVDNVEN